MHNSQMVGTAQLPTNRWINKTWTSHMMEYYSAKKRDELLTPARLCMDLENILSERRSHKTAQIM